MRLERRDAWVSLGRRLLAQAGPGGGWLTAPEAGRADDPATFHMRALPIRALRPGTVIVPRVPAPGETAPALPIPDSSDHARQPRPLPVRTLIAWPGVLVGLPALHTDGWFAEGPIVPLGDGDGTPEHRPGLWSLLRAEASRQALPDQGWTWLLPEQSAHARLADAEAHGEAAAAWRHTERPGRTPRLQRLGPLLCLTDVVSGSDYLLGAFPA